MSADSAPWRRQSSQTPGSPCSPAPPPGGPPPPPPPPYNPASIPPLRIPTEAKSGGGGGYEMPAAIQNAMMTKDKKPFTYTPGGLDLNQIRSPRMAKRLSRNAHIEDSCSGASSAPPPPPVQPQQLPPQALAVMQPQIAVAVLPPGTKLPKTPTSPNGTLGSPPSNGALPSQPDSGVPPPPPIPTHGPPPPPPPPPMPSGGAIPPPPPIPNNGVIPTKQTSSQVAPADSSNQFDTLKRSQPRPDYIADIANHAHTLKRVNQPPRSMAGDPQSQNFPPVQLKQTGYHPKSTQDKESNNKSDEYDGREEMPMKSPTPPNGAPSVKTGNIDIPQSPQPQVPQQNPPRTLQSQISLQNLQQTLQQIVNPSHTPSPPIGNHPKPFQPQPSPEIQKSRFSPPRAPATNDTIKAQPQLRYPAPQPPSPAPVKVGSKNSPDVIGPIYNRTSPPKEVVTVFQPQVFQDVIRPDRFQGKRPPGLAMPLADERGPDSSPNLRQAPAPNWLSSAHRTPQHGVPAWASRPESNTNILPAYMTRIADTEPQATSTASKGKVHIIPIRMEGSNDVIQHPSSQANKIDHQANLNSYQQQAMLRKMPSSPVQNLPQPPNQYGPLTRPPTPVQHKPQMPTTPGQYLPQMPVSPVHPLPPTPMSPNQHLQQTPVPKTPRGWSPVNSPPVQSRSFRVLQRITGSDQEVCGDNGKNDDDVVFLLNRVQQKKELQGCGDLPSHPAYTPPPTYHQQFYSVAPPACHANGQPGESEY